MVSAILLVLSVWLIRYRAEEPAAKKGFIERILPGFQRIVSAMIRFRWIVVPAYLAICGLLLWVVGRQVGTELFPQVDSGQFVIRFRSPPGSNRSGIVGNRDTCSVARLNPVAAAVADLDLLSYFGRF